MRMRYQLYRRQSGVIVSDRKMLPGGSSKAFFLPILVFAFLSVVRCSSNCASARLSKDPKAKVIDDCNLFDDWLNLNLNQLTAKPLCIREIRFKFGKGADAKRSWWQLERKTSAASIENLFVGSERCVSQIITAKV